MELASKIRPAESRRVGGDSAPHRNVIQRKCACGGKSGAGGSCEECDKEAVSLQRYSADRTGTAIPGGTPGRAAPGRTADIPPAAEPPDSRQPDSRGLIVEDGAEQIGPGQMRKTEFLNQLESAVCATADQELARVGRTAQGCPYIERWIRYYRTRTGNHVQRALVRYAPEAARAASARDYIPIVTQRIRQAVTVWAATGQITGVPEELAAQLSGGGLLGAAARLASGIAGAVGGALGSIGRAIGGIFAKTREGAPLQEGDVDRVRDQLGPGQKLDSGAKTRMEHAMGHDFSSVRVHTDSRAAELSSELNARAFTVGSDVAFAAGEYRPGTLIGDALLAHELAHVVQQSGLGSGDAAASPQTSEYNALEQDADISAAKATMSLWGGGKSVASNAAGKSSPSIKSGLRLSRCGRETGVKAALGVPKASAAAVATCSPDAVTLDQVTQAAATVGVRIPPGRLPSILGITTAKLPQWAFSTKFLGGNCSLVLTTEPEFSLTQFAFTKPGQYLIGKTAPDDERLGFSARRLGQGCGGVPLPTYVKVTPEASDKARQAEVEHCEDFKLAFALSYEKYRAAMKGFQEDAANDQPECNAKVLRSLGEKSGIDVSKWNDVGKCLWRLSPKRDAPPNSWHQWDLSNGRVNVEKDEATGECKQIILTPDHETNLIEVRKHPSSELIKDCGEK